jgi:hypothetical protein
MKYQAFFLEEDFEDIRIRKSKKDRHHNAQKKKDRQSTKHYTENQRLSNTNPWKTQVLWKAGGLHDGYIILVPLT